MKNGYVNPVCKKAVACGLTLVSASFLLSSCHFGDVDDVRPKEYDDVIRNFTISLDAVTPTGGSAVRTAISDRTLNGLDIVWTAGDEIAMFCHDASVQTDSKQPVIKLSQASDIESSDVANADNPDELVSWASFTAKTQLKAGNTANLEVSHNYSFVYPYSQVAHEQSNASSIYLDFTGQDGSLATLQRKYHYAWGVGAGSVAGDADNAKMNFTDVTGSLCNDAVAHANHKSWEEGNVVLDNKMSIIRFSLVHQDDNGTKTSFKQYLEQNNLGEITQIILHDDNGNLSDVAMLDVKNGNVQNDGSSTICLGNLDNVRPSFIEITEQGANSDLSANGQSWGTTFYVSIPVQNKKAELKCWLEIHVGSQGQDVYYVYMQNRTFAEGRYYLTAPLICTDKKTAELNLQTVFDYESTQITNVPNESLLVWDAYGSRIVWDRNCIYYIPRYLFDNVRAGAIMTLDFKIDNSTDGYLQLDNGTKHQGNTPLPIKKCINYPGIFEDYTGRITIEAMTKAGVINWQEGVSVSFELTQEILDAIQNGSQHGVGISFVGDGGAQQLIDRAVVSNITKDQLPSLPDYGTWFQNNNGNGYIGYNDKWDIDSHLKDAVCSMRDGDVLRFYYTNQNAGNSNTVIGIYPNNNGNEVLNDNKPSHQFSVNQREGYFDVVVDESFRYFSAFYEGLHFETKGSGAITINKITLTSE